MVGLKTERENARGERGTGRVEGERDETRSEWTRRARTGVYQSPNK